MQDLETHYFECSCYSAEHILRFVYDPEENELYTEVQLIQYRNIFKRIWIAIKYIFGYKCRYGVWDNWIMKIEDCERLKQLCERVIEKSKEMKNKVPSPPPLRQIKESEDRSTIIIHG